MRIVSRGIPGLAGAAVAATLFAIPVAPVAAQDAGAPAAWWKFCQPDQASKQEVCVILQESRAATGQFIASATVRELPGKPKALIVSVLPGMMIQPGVRVQIDDGTEHDFKYGICVAAACYAELEIDDAFIDAMKSGSNLTITTVNAQAKSVSFPLTLAGFTSAFDGPAMDPAKRQAELEAAQKAQNESSRQQLIDQQKKSSGQTN